MRVLEEIVGQVERLRRRVERLEVQEGDSVWQDWTPTVTQSGAVAVTVTYARYIQIGKLVIATALLAVTGSGTGNNAIVVGALPVTPAQHANLIAGAGEVFISGTASYVGSCRLVATSTLHLIRDGAGAGVIGQDPNVQLTDNDVISFTVMYQAA